VAYLPCRRNHIISAVTSSILVFADSGWDHHMDDWGAGWWIVMALMMVIFWALVIFGAVWLVRSLSGSHHLHSRTPTEVLDHRLASGEISAEEYHRLRETLEGDGGKSHEA
jgi:putative membrane protein